MPLMGTVKGTIKDSTAGPVVGALIRAWDSDSGLDGLDDFMGESYTDANGAYVISYDRTAGKWDTKIVGSNSYRPDIYVTVLIRNNLGQYSKVWTSETHDDWVMANTLTIDKTLSFNTAPGTSVARKQTAFDPRRHGFHFDNFAGTFVITVPGLGNLNFSGAGFCGGMSAAAFNRFKRNRAAEAASSPPALGTSLRKELNDRQLATLSPGTVMRLLDWQAAPDQPQTLASHTVGARTKTEWPILQARINQGKPTILFLVTERGGPSSLGGNHQVLAIGYEFDTVTRDLAITLYDSNCHDSTSKLCLNIGMPRNQIGAKLMNCRGTRDVRGFFVNTDTDAASS